MLCTTIAHNRVQFLHNSNNNKYDSHISEMPKCRKVVTGVGSRAVCSSKVYIFVFSLTVVSSVVEC